MKNNWIAAAVVAFAQVAGVASAHASATPDRELNCRNMNYREAVLSVNDQTIVIKDTFFDGRLEIGKLIEELSAGQINFHPQSVTLILPTRLANCDFATPTLFACSHPGMPSTITVEGWSQVGGVSSHSTIHLDVELKNIGIKTSLKAPGPVTIGSETTKIDLSEMHLLAKADVVVNGKSIPVKFAPSFTLPGGLNPQCVLK